MSTQAAPKPKAARDRQVLNTVTVRFAGDSGDGVQITGGQFTATTAAFGNDLATLPDYPAEIRAPAGTLPGVSGFQIQFSSNDIHTPGDQPDVLVAFNPAALKVHIADLVPNGIVIVDTSAFNKVNLAKAGYKVSPLEDGSLSGFRVFSENITEKTLLALRDVEGTSREKQRCKNFYALGMAYWLFNRPLEPTLRWIRDKFSKMPHIVAANETALKGGYAYCEMTDVYQAVAYEIPPAPSVPGTYRNISGNEALAYGLVAASQQSSLPLFYGAYPITPASDILHELSKHKNFGVITFQAEDEIAAMAATVGASYAGALGVTGSAGPGIALKSEAASLALTTELPVVIVNVQRGGPSTGLPTKTEQADLLFTLYGRHGESPVCVLAPATPGECFKYAYEACRLAVKYMTPVYLLSDGYLANGAEPWRVPEMKELSAFPVKFETNPQNFESYRRDPKTLARPWAVPGTPGLEHRIGGLEKRDITGNVSYDPVNHEKMSVLRRDKIAKIVQDVPDLEVKGPDGAELLVLGWGSTYGAIRAAVERAHGKGLKVAQAHLRHLSPLPKNTGDVLKRFKKILIPEMNLGQLSFLLRALYLIDVTSLNKIQGQPFKAVEILNGIEAVLAGEPVRTPDESANGAAVSHGGMPHVNGGPGEG
ncbi:MAG: 2-oxoacid:acceptor oxidoreductase subunit alpha [Planctomycetes bacterium]|nr:2-oxoacid:acceptor oxidoreductase subunit alpha [Planctomycetota bacterium]